MQNTGLDVPQSFSINTISILGGCCITKMIFNNNDSSCKNGKFSLKNNTHTQKSS